jgi:cell division protein FtsQ
MRRVSGKRGAPASWKRSAALAGFFALGFVVVFGSGFLFLRNGPSLGDRLLALTATAGLAVADIEVEGRSMTDRTALLHALGAGRGTPILSVNPAEAKARIEALPWVRSAAVARLLPDRLFIRLTERHPLAFWQKNGKLQLIDHDGVVVTDQHLERFPGLIVVVGDDAPKHAAELLDMLVSEPKLAERVVAAVRVGNRRWNLRFDNGIDAQLPEENAAAAWAQLAEIERTSGILGREVEAIDLRLPDRLVIRTVPEPPKETPKKGRPAAKATKNT